MTREMSAYEGARMRSMPSPPPNVSSSCRLMRLASTASGLGTESVKRESRNVSKGRCSTTTSALGMKPVAKLRAVATVRCMLFAMKRTWSGRRHAFRSKRPRSPSRSRNQPPIAVSSAAPFRESSPGADVQANHLFVVDSARFCFAVPRGARRLCRLTITTWRSSAAHPPAAATATKTHNSFFIFDFISLSHDYTRNPVTSLERRRSRGARPTEFRLP